MNRDLSKNNFSGALPPIPSLNFLNLSANYFDTMPASTDIHSYMGVTSLYAIFVVCYFYGRHLSSGLNLKKQTNKQTNKQTLQPNRNLSSNAFDMPLPDWLFLSSQILTLDISHNKFSGPIPKPSPYLKQM